MSQLEVLTSMHRRRMASRHRLRLGKVSQGRRLAGLDQLQRERAANAMTVVDGVVRRADTSGHSYQSRWHWERLQGQAERFDRVRACGECRRMLEGYDPTTGELMTSQPFETRCGNWRVCPRCLKARQVRLSRGVLEARERALRLRRVECSPRYRGREGRWSERLLTLTVPHSGDAGEDAAQLARAWGELQRRLLTHLRVDRGAHEKPVWVRALEVAPSEDGGHAHLHVWWVGPFVDHVWLRVAWGRVLEGQGIVCPQRAWNEVMHGAPSSDWRSDYGRSRLRDQRAKRWCRTRRGAHGRQVEKLPWPHVYVNRAKEGTEGAAEYATKVGVAYYVTKGSDVKRMHPLHAASVYQAFEGRRAIQWARGWAPRIVSKFFWRLRRMTNAERDEWVGKTTPVSSVGARKKCEKASADSAAPRDGPTGCTTTPAWPVEPAMPKSDGEKTSDTTRQSGTSQLSFGWQPR